MMMLKFIVLAALFSCAFGGIFSPDELKCGIHYSMSSETDIGSVYVDVYQMAYGNIACVKANTRIKTLMSENYVTSVFRGDHNKLVTRYGNSCIESKSSESFIKMEDFEYTGDAETVSCPNNVGSCKKYCNKAEACVIVDNKERYVQLANGTVITYYDDDVVDLDVFAVELCEPKTYLSAPEKICGPFIPQWDCPAHFKMTKGGKLYERWLVNGTDGFVEKCQVESDDFSYMVYNNEFISWNGDTCDSGNSPFPSSIALFYFSSFEYKTRENVRCNDGSLNGCKKYCNDNNLCLIADKDNRIISYDGSEITWYDDGVTEFTYDECVPGRAWDIGVTCPEPPPQPPQPPQPTYVFNPQWDCPAHFKMTKGGKLYERWLAKGTDGFVEKCQIVSDDFSYLVYNNEYVSWDHGSCSSGYSPFPSYIELFYFSSFEFKTNESVRCNDASHNGCTKYCNNNNLCLIADKDNRIITYDGSEITWYDDGVTEFIYDECVPGRAWDIGVRCPGVFVSNEKNNVHLSMFAQSDLCSISVDALQMKDKGNVKAVTDIKTIVGDFTISSVIRSENVPHSITLFGKECSQPSTTFTTLLKDFEYFGDPENALCPNKSQGCKKFCDSKKVCIIADQNGRYVQTEYGTTVNYYTDSVTSDMFQLDPCERTPGGGGDDSEGDSEVTLDSASSAAPLFFLLLFACLVLVFLY